MKIVFLGTGGTYPSKWRNVSSIALQVGPDAVMFDCGEGTQRQLMHSRISFMRVRAIFITHLHADHFLGLAGLIQSMSLNGRTESLTVAGPDGTKETMRSVMGLGYFESHFDVDARDLQSGDVVEFNRFTVRCAEGRHTIPNLGYSLEERMRPGKFNVAEARRLGIPKGPMYRELQQGRDVKIAGRRVVPAQVLGPPRRGRKVTYTGDTRPCDDITVLAKDANVLIHDSTLDSSFADLAAEFGHSTAAEAAQTAKTAGVQKLFLTHISPRYDDIGALEAEARGVFDNATVAEDLDEYYVPLDE